MIGKADLHIHSYYSPDAFSSPRDILQRAKEAGLNLIAITDHHTIEGAEEAQKMALEFGLEVIIGEEILTKQGEIIGLFLKERIPPDLPLLEAVREVKRQEGLVIVPHPLSFWQDGLGEKLLYKLASEIDGLEVLSSGWTGKKNFAKIQNINNNFLKLAPLAGSDAHFAELVGKACTIFEGKTPADLYRAVKNKSTSVKGDFWSKWDYLSYVWHWIKRSTKRGGPLIIFNILWGTRKIKKFFRRFSNDF